MRAHQLADEGFSYHFTSSATGEDAADGPAPLPPVITVFSAPNYCGVHGNRAAVLNLSWTEPMSEASFFTFEAVSEPPPKSFVDQVTHVTEGTA